MRQLLIESLLLGAVGAALGCVFAYGGTKGIAALIPDGCIPREVIRLNVPVLLFSPRSGRRHRGGLWSRAGAARGSPKRRGIAQETLAKASPAVSVATGCATVWSSWRLRCR